MHLWVGLKRVTVLATPAIAVLENSECFFLASRLVVFCLLFSLISPRSL